MGCLILCPVVAGLSVCPVGAIAWSVSLSYSACCVVCKSICPMVPVAWSVDLSCAALVLPAFSPPYQLQISSEDS